MLKKNNKKTHWFGLNVPCTSSSEDAVSNFLFECGATGLIQEKGAIVAYFPANIYSEELQFSIQRYLDDLSPQNDEVVTKEIEIFHIQDRDWNAEWKKHLRPIVITPNLAIKPSWIDTSQRLAKHVIEIDPQMAFGTGSHATTKLVLRLIDKYGCSGCKVLDVGTGSGILAIAAAKIGAAKIYAFDNDPIAAETASYNVRNNCASDRVYVFTGTIDTLRDNDFDLILANINRTAILEILPAIINRVNKNGTIILSGILKEEEQLLYSEISSFNIKITETQYEDEWIAIVGQKTVN